MNGERIGVAIPERYRPDAGTLHGKTILVTGASDGIGRAAAASYARYGATVVLMGRSREKLEQVYDAIEAAGGPEPVAVPFDLAQEAEEPFFDLAAAIGGQLPHLDGLLLNAGILGERRSLEQTTWKAWREVMRINVDSQFLCIKALMPLLREAPRASLVFTSSGVGRAGRAYWGAYSVSKFATEAMMQILADETENTSAVRVNAINPGATNTAMRRAAYPAEPPDSNPAPDALMRSYLYLMDDASIGVTGISFDAQ